MALKPTLSIPTGYEQFQRAAEEKRQIAKAMLAQGLQPLNNPTHWAQVLGQWGQGLAGNRMLRQANEMDDRTSQRILQDYTNRRGGFYADTADKGITAQAIVSKYGNDPMLTEDVKPYRDAIARAMTEREKLVKHNGRLTRAGEAIGQVDNDPNSLVFADDQGRLGINAVRAAAGGMQSGALSPEGGYQTSGVLPGSPAAIYAQAKSEGHALLNPIPFRDPATGKTYYQIGGKVYDNPEGR